MADFRRTWRFLKRWEGGYVDHPSDPGGATNHGLSLRWYKQTVDPEATKETIRALTEEDAISIVEDYWWKGKLYYAIQSQDIADRYFGFVFNMGPRNATRILQRAVNKESCTTIAVDGVLGPLTVEATNAIYPAKLLTSLRAEAEAFYKRLIKKKPAFNVFENGWLRRANA
jgi:lysozyme family protein